MLFSYTIILIASRLIADPNPSFFSKHSKSFLKWLHVTCLASLLPSSPLSPCSGNTEPSGTIPSACSVLPSFVFWITHPQSLSSASSVECWLPQVDFRASLPASVPIQAPLILSCNCVFVSLHFVDLDPLYSVLLKGRISFPFTSLRHQCPPQHSSHCYSLFSPDYKQAVTFPSFFSLLVLILKMAY